MKKKVENKISFLEVKPTEKETDLINTIVGNFKIFCNGQVVSIYSVDGRCDRERFWRIELPKWEFDELIKYYIKPRKIKQSK